MKVETRQQCGPTQETGSKSKLETRYNMYPSSLSGKGAAYSMGLRSTQAAEPEIRLEISTPIAQLRQGPTPLGQAVICLGLGAGEGPQGTLSRLVGLMTALQDFRVWSFIQHTKRVCYSLGQKKGQKGFFLCMCWSLSDRNTFGCLIRIFTSEQIIPGVEMSLP